MNHHENVGRRLLRHDTDALNLLGQTRQRARDAVLHLDLRHVRIGALGEGHRQRHPAVGRRLRAHIEHAFDTVDRLFERGGHGFGNDFRAGAGIARRHLHRWRGDGRVFAQGKPEQRDHAGNQHQCRKDDGEDRAVDEKARQVH